MRIIIFLCIFIPLGYEIIASVLCQVTFRYCYWLKQKCKSLSGLIQYVHMQRKIQRR